MNLRPALSTAGLLTAVLLTAACAAPTVGTPVAAAGATVASASSDPTAASSTAATTSAATTSASTESATTESTTTESAKTESSTESITTESTTTESSATESSTGSNTPDDLPTLDADTELWLTTACTDMGGLIGLMLNVPLTEPAYYEDYRIAWRDYYATLADNLLVMIGTIDTLTPPAVTDGAALHDGYRLYLASLADLAGNGAIVIDSADPDEASVTLAVDQVTNEMQDLGNQDFGLDDFEGDELRALMTQIPACAEMVG